MSKGSKVGITTGLTAGVLFSVMAEIFLLSTASKPALGPTHLPIQWVQEIKRPWRETDHFPPYSLEVKNGGSIPPLPHKSSLHSV
jgi:hypothetical protein